VAFTSTESFEILQSAVLVPDRPEVDFITQNWLLFLVAIVSGAMLLQPMLQGGTSTVSVGTAEAVRLINREKAVLVDVGESREFEAEHAANALNVPFGQLDKSTDLPKNKATPVVLLCPSGSRAGRAAGLLRKQGYEKACAVAGGTRAWRDASLPIERGAAPRA
jgi:rhodanese-related sulfurtransferase